MGLRWDQATHWKKKAKRTSEPSRAVVWERKREKIFTSPTPRPHLRSLVHRSTRRLFLLSLRYNQHARDLHNTSNATECSTLEKNGMLAIGPSHLVPRVFWLVSQRGDARTPLGHRQ